MLLRRLEDDPFGVVVVVGACLDDCHGQDERSASSFSRVLGQAERSARIGVSSHEEHL